MEVPAAAAELLLLQQQVLVRRSVVRQRSSASEATSEAWMHSLLASREFRTDSQVKVIWMEGSYVFIQADADGRSTARPR